MKTILAIDPGASGGIAVSGPGGVRAFSMPSTIKDIHDMLQDMNRAAPAGIMAYCERVGGYQPGNSGPGAVKFAEHVGVLKALLVALAIPHEFPTPASWMHAYTGKPTYKRKKTDGYSDAAWKGILRERKQRRKNAIKARSQQLYPHLTVTLKTSDALGIMWYGIQKQEGTL